MIITEASKNKNNQGTEKSLGKILKPYHLCTQILKYVCAGNGITIFPVKIEIHMS